MCVRSPNYLSSCVHVLSMRQEGTTWGLTLQAQAPLTSLTISRDDALYAGCWDKSIYGVPVTPSVLKSVRSRLEGHTDFVKCVLATSLSGRPVLLSGGADAVIVVWDLSDGKPLHKLKGHTKALQSFAIDPLSLPDGSIEPADSFTVHRLRTP